MKAITIESVYNNLFKHSVLASFGQEPDDKDGGSRKRRLLVYTASRSRAARGILRMLQGLRNAGFTVTDEMPEHRKVTVRQDLLNDGYVEYEVEFFTYDGKHPKDLKDLMFTDAFISVAPDDVNKIKKYVARRIGQYPAKLKGPFFMLIDKKTFNG